MSENTEITVKDVENAYGAVVLASRAYRGTADEHETLTKSLNTIKTILESYLRSKTASVTATAAAAVEPDAILPPEAANG